MIFATRHLRQGSSRHRFGCLRDTGTSGFVDLAQSTFLDRNDHRSPVKVPMSRTPMPFRCHFYRRGFQRVISWHAPRLTPPTEQPRPHPIPRLSLSRGLIRAPHRHLSRTRVHSARATGRAELDPFGQLTSTGGTLGPFLRRLRVPLPQLGNIAPRLTQLAPHRVLGVVLDLEFSLTGLARHINHDGIPGANGLRRIQHAILIGQPWEFQDRTSESHRLRSGPRIC